jgi:hypothetical protein
MSTRPSQPDVARLVAAMVQARDAVERQSWWHPQEPTGEAWWADVLADPRARKRERRTDLAVKQAFYRLADEKRENHTCRVQQVRLAGGIFARPPDRLSWCGLRDAQPAQPSRRTELQQARLPLGSLRRSLRRADRGRAVARPYHESAAVPVGAWMWTPAVRTSRGPHTDARATPRRARPRWRRSRRAGGGSSSKIGR